MFFVIKHHRIDGHIYPRNARLGGWLDKERAVAAACRESLKNDRPECVLQTEARTIIGISKSGVFTHV